MKPRGEKPISAAALNAAKLSHVPGVTIEEACERFEVTKAEVSRARKAPESRPSLAELAVAALTKNGTRRDGSTSELAGVASWIDYINKDGCTADDVRALLGALVIFEGERWRFEGSWP